MLKKNEYLIEFEGREYIARVSNVDWPKNKVFPAFEFKLYTPKGWRASAVEHRVYAQPELYEKVQDLILREMVVDPY